MSIAALAENRIVQLVELVKVGTLVIIEKDQVLSGGKKIKRLCHRHSLWYIEWSFIISKRL